MRTKWLMFVSCFALSLCCGCGTANSLGPSLQASFVFSQGQQGWSPGVSDYPPSIAGAINFVASFMPLQPPLDTSTSALYMSGLNGSDDLFMFWKGRYGGLVPGTTYTATFTVTIASNTPSGCTGGGGQPGESVYVKAGASSIEPQAVLSSSGEYEMNVDKGNQSTGGANAVVLGNIATGVSCDGTSSFVWQLKQLSSGNSGVSVQADSAGGVWLLVGTDSGFEGPTALYVTQFQATFERN